MLILVHFQIVFYIAISLKCHFLILEVVGVYSGTTRLIGNVNLVVSLNLVMNTSVQARSDVPP